MIYRRGTHRTQYDGSPMSGSNCTPTSGANGAREATDGAYDHSGGYVRTLVARAEETTPSSPGWSLRDLDLAMSRAGVPFVIGTGGWEGLKVARAKGLGIVLQGDSDQFANTTCSGAFDGDHAIYVHPEENSEGNWLIGDPICRDWRWERPGVLKNYAEKFSNPIKFGIFTTPLRKVTGDTGDEHMAQLSITDQKPAVITIAAGSKRYMLDGVADGYVFDKQYVRYSPYAVGTRRAYFASVDGKTVLRLVAPALTSPIVPPPDLTPYSQTDLDAKYKAGLADGVAATINKIKSALGL